MLDVDLLQLCGKCCPFSRQTRSGLGATARIRPGQSRYRVCPVTGNCGQVTSPRSNGRNRCGADLASVACRGQKEHGMSVAGRGDTSDPDYGADGTDAPAKRTAQCGQKVGGNDQHDTDGDPQRPLNG